MSYDSIDPAIRAWVRRYGLTLFDSVQGSPDHSFRTVYLSSDRGECFQIWMTLKHMDYEQVVSRFADSVREYCHWIEGSPGESDLFDAFRLLSRLQADAVMR